MHRWLAADSLTYYYCHKLNPSQTLVAPGRPSISSQMSHPSPMPHAIPDEDTIRKHVLEIHKPDGRHINVRRILDVVESILNSETAAGKTLEEQLHLPEYDTTEIPFKIKQLSHQMSSKWSGDVGLYNMTINLLTMLSSYEWEAKAVMILAAFANNHGDLCILTKVSNQNTLAKRMSLLKQITAPHPNGTFDEQKSAVKAIKSVLNLTKRIVEFKELPAEFVVPQPVDSDDLPNDIYYITRAVLICSSHLINFGLAGYEIPVEREDLQISKIEDIDEKLKGLLDDSRKQIEEKEAQDSYEALKRAFSETDHSDGKDIFKLLFNVQDEKQDMPLCKGGETKAKAKLDVLQTGKNVLLLITSGLDISKERATYLSNVYKDFHQNHEMIWIPIVNAPKEFWTAEKENEFKNLVALMGFYSVNDPQKSIGTGLHKFVQKDLFRTGEKDFFRIRKEPVVVVLDSKGKIAHKNAMGMMLAWGADASPFDTIKEKYLWTKETWRPALVFGSINPICQWINADTQGAKKVYIFLYGGNSVEWVRQFNDEVKRSFSSDIEPKMMYLGKNKEVRSSIAQNDCLDYTSTWLFWARLKSTLLSRMQYISKTNLKEEDDEIARGLKTLLAYEALGETGGWCLLCTSDKVVRCGDGDKMLKIVTEYGTWKGNVKDNKGFHEAFDEYYNTVSFTAHHQPSCELEYPTTFIKIPENEKCPDCNTDMYKLITFTCCHCHDDYNMQEKDVEDATNM